MHICICSRNISKGNNKKFEYPWAIYIWDTRQILESGCAPAEKMDWDIMRRGARHVPDNHATLQGANDENAKFVMRHMNDRI